MAQVVRVFLDSNYLRTKIEKPTKFYSTPQKITKNKKRVHTRVLREFSNRNCK